jgi:hypothetical protein
MLPRLDPPEIEYFEQLMRNKEPGTTMVEWGSGGSTCMFVPFFSTGRFISIEHNHEWYEKVHAEIVCGDKYPRECFDNFVYLYSPPMYMGYVVNKDFYGYGVPLEENPCFSKTYVDPTGDLRCPDIWNSDIYFVDGICRGAVLATIWAKAKNRDAHVYIHDYFGPENREGWYNWASRLYNRVDQIGTTLARLYL